MSASCPRGLLALIVPALAAVCEEGQLCSPLAELSQEQRELSLMQSGRSVMPAMMTNGASFAMDDALVDDLANIEDEFDDGAPIKLASFKQAAPPSKVSKPSLYMETLAVIAALALASRGFSWVTRVTPKSDAPVQMEASTAESSEPKAIFALGGSKNFPALEQAVRAGDKARCLQLLQEGGRWAVRQEDSCGCTALHVAAHCGSAPMARLLLEHSAKVDACELWDETPLHIAARSGSLEVCDILLARGADMNAVNAHGFTPLLMAGQAKQEAICELLLERGAGLGGIDETEVPPLLNALLFRRMLVGAFPRGAEAPQSEPSEEENEDHYFDD